ncbi:MAG TPA: hypothetical protein VMW54_13810 [Terriglobia bacterium]|nr:hypothetical protein [Terriglobia bacterium]
MRRKLNIFSLCVMLCSPLFAQNARFAIPAGAPAGRPAIWILGADGRFSEYGGADFHLLMSSLSLPREAVKHPENISISRAGQVLYAGLVPGTSLRRLWSSNRYAPVLTGGTEDTRPTKDGVLVTSATPWVTFSADGRRLFWFENRLSVLQQENLDVSETGEFLSWTSDLTGRELKPLVNAPLPPCKCGTGACEETCPIITPWAPESGVSDFFFLTRYIPGQTSPDYLETDLYQTTAGAWKERKLPQPVYEFLDATGHGNTYIIAIPDAGCCGWENESDDVTYLVHGEKRDTLFDELARFHNKDYDVSFFTSKALFSPDSTAAAYTIEASSKPGQAIRLADQGKDNPEELRQIENDLGKLPRVEVVALSDLAKPRFSLANTELIGWLDARRLLVWQRGHLFAINAANGQSTPTGLKAEKAAYVFIR